MTPDGWESDIFTRTNTVEYVRRLYASSRFRQKKRFADYHGYSRIRSLGFSHHEIYNKSISDVEFIRQVSQRKGVAVNHYKQQILNGHATPQVRTPSMSRGSG